MTKTLQNYLPNKALGKVFRGSFITQGKRTVSRFYIIEDLVVSEISSSGYIHGEMRVYFVREGMTTSRYADVNAHKNDKEADPVKFKRHIRKLEKRLHINWLIKMETLANRRKQMTGAVR